MIARSIVLCCLLVVMCGGCSTGVVSVMPKLPEKYEKLGPAKGSACGSMLIGPTAYNFIPVLLNSRLEDAYKDALQSVPGARALTDVTISEDWYWWVIGSAHCTRISGEAIR